ncbi:hypothetical protein [Streptomyces sp. SUK 48]|uniref:hypothetical protein n=1 Tax=Streptomyces sp. SUK 48 TaxID=2582831 RepID=UPI00129ABA47|nr:hypothetical protein [Streptomyces sp. SUK 48]
MTQGRAVLPACARGRFETGRSFAALAARGESDWHDTVMNTIQVDPVLRQVDSGELRDSLREVFAAQALELAGLISAGSLLHGPHPSLRVPNAERDICLREVLGAVGDDARFFTNHGHAEDGDGADFLASSFHADTLAGLTVDVCLIGVSVEHVLVLWRFEDD